MMKRIFQIFLFLLGLPTIIFFCAMSISVLLFALPAVIFGNPLNLFYVIWWGIGAYGIWSGIHAAIAYGKPDYTIGLWCRIGIFLGIFSLIPIMPAALAGNFASDSMSYITLLAFLGLIPACILLYLSFMKSKNEPVCPAQQDADPDSNPK